MARGAQECPIRDHAARRQAAADSRGSPRAGRLDQARTFGIDPSDPDPGRVTVRRLNRVEYRNTIRDLLGVDYDTTSEFPSDDTGHGFDNNGDVLTLSPLLLEKYLAAATTIIARAVPMVPRVVAEQAIPAQASVKHGAAKIDGSPISLSYYEPASASTTIHVEHDGKVPADPRPDREREIRRRSNRLATAAGSSSGPTAKSSSAGNSAGRMASRSASNSIATGRPAPISCRSRSSRSRLTKNRSGRCRFASSRRRSAGRRRRTVLGPARDYARFFPTEIPADADERRRYAREFLAGSPRRHFGAPWTTRRKIGS